MKVETLIELLAWKPPKMEALIGGGILYPETRLIVYGEFGTWKSMLAMHTGLCISSGARWLYYTTSRSRVLLIQTEIPKPLFRDRVDKYITQQKITPHNRISFVTELGLRLDTPYGVAALDKAMAESVPRVCIIDPIYRSMGGDISSSVDVQHTIDNIDMVMKKFHCAVVLIAHEHKGLVDEKGKKINTGANKIMGSSYWADWADSIAHVEEVGDDKVCISWEKARNAYDLLVDCNISIDRRSLKFTVE